MAPRLVILGRRAHRGHLRAYLLWLGCLAFTVYNYAIYAFSVHFGPLFLVWVAVLFTMLWLREILPAVVSGAPSPSASAWQVPTNPVHVLDLAFFLPATATSGVLLLRRHRLGYTTAPGQLTWLALTCLPILATPLVAGSRGHQPDWALAGPVGVILLASLAALAWLLRQPANRPNPR